MLNVPYFLSESIEKKFHAWAHRCRPSTIGLYKLLLL